MCHCYISNVLFLIDLYNHVCLTVRGILDVMIESN